MTHITAVKSIPSQCRYMAVLEDGTEQPISRCDYFRLLIGLVLPLAEAGEYATGGKTELEARRNAEAIAEARRILAQ